MKKKLSLFIIPVLCFSCGGSGVRGKDDNNVLRYAKDGNYFFKGSFALGIFDRPEAASIFDLQKSQSTPAPDEVRNDCIVASSITIASLIQNELGTLSIPLYDTSREQHNVPKSFFTSSNQGSIKGRTFTYLYKEGNDFYWRINDDEKFFLFFTPAYQNKITSFKSLTYCIEINYSFSYFDTNELRLEDRHEIVKKFKIENKAKSCFNNSVIEENFDVPLCNIKTSDVYAPTITINGMSGTIDPAFVDSGEEKNIGNYIRRA